MATATCPTDPFTEAFRSLLADVGRERIIEAAGEGAVHLARLVPGLGDAPAAPVQSPDDGVDSRPRLFEAVLDVLGRLALERPIVLVLEDLHWADPSSRALLTYLAGRLRDERLVLIGTYRSDELTRRHPLLPLLALLERLPSVERIDLSRLDRDEVQAQIAGILGTVPGARFVDNVARPIRWQSVLRRGTAHEFLAGSSWSRLADAPGDPARTAVRPGPGDAARVADRGGHRSARGA